MITEVTSKNIDNLRKFLLTENKIFQELKYNPFAKLLVYIEDEKIIGYLYYSEIYERVEINQFEVDFIHRNCGIGTKLMKYLTDSVDKSITLEVKEDNLAAINLYKKLGFKQKAIRKGYYQGIDGILMERDK